MLTSLGHVTSSAYLPYTSGDVVAVELISGLGLVGHLQATEVDSLGAALGGHIIRLPGISDCSLTLSPLPPINHQYILPPFIALLSAGLSGLSASLHLSSHPSIHSSPTRRKHERLPRPISAASSGLCLPSPHRHHPQRCCSHSLGKQCTRDPGLLHGVFQETRL